MSERKLEIGEFSLRGKADELCYREDPDAFPFHRGNDHAAVLVRLDVDGWFNLVSTDPGQSNPRRVLDRAIEALTEVRDQLNVLNPDATGRCMTPGEWGRCRLGDGHDEEHAFPTEEEWGATQLPSIAESAKAEAEARRRDVA